MKRFLVNVTINESKPGNVIEILIREIVWFIDRYDFHGSDFRCVTRPIRVVMIREPLGRRIGKPELRGIEQYLSLIAI
jgi:hypothetical protein